MRSLALALSLPFAAVACVQDHRDPPMHRAPAADPDARTTPPSGSNAMVPQVQPTIAVTHAEPPATPLELTDVAHLAADRSGGAMLVWSVSERSPSRVRSTIAMRMFDASGLPSTTGVLRSVRGTVRGISAAIGRSDALVTWAAEYGGTGGQFAALRVHTDGRIVGGPNSLGVYLVADNPGADGLPSDGFGFPIEAVTIGDRYAVALRSSIVDCAGIRCPSVRVADVGPENQLRGLGGIDHPWPRQPIFLLAPPEGPWSLALTVGAPSASPIIRTYGEGALSRVAWPGGTSLVAAWLENRQARGVVRREEAGRGHAESFELVGYDPVDAGAASVRRIDRARMVCRDGVAAVELSTRRGVSVVPVNSPGAPTLARWTLGRAPAPARAPTTVVWAGGGLLAAYPHHVEFARCAGTTLATPTVVAWGDGVAADASAVHD